MKKSKYLIALIVLMLCVCMVTMLTACQENSKEFKMFTDAKLFRQTSSLKIIGETTRQKVNVKDGGLQSYPSYTNNVKDTALKEKILEENNSFFKYDKVDAEGNLYVAVKDDKNKSTYQPTGEKMFKHSSADGIYQESLPDDAVAKVAKVHLRPSRYGNNLTGLYVPAGEIVKIILDDNIVSKGGVKVDIGYGPQRGESINIPVGRDFTRMPIVRKTLNLTENINYIASPLGGSLYIQSESLMNSDSSLEYEVTVIGAVESPQYYYGATTDADWDKIRSAPGLFFHMEMRSGIRLTMPSIVVRNKSAEEMRLLGQFYDNVATLSNKLQNGAWFSEHPVDCLFDSFVPAGAAVAIVGADVCVNPTGWAYSATDYYSITNNGAWGVLHEFNHHHQGWGAGAGGEVTNNVANIMTYMLYTNIGAYRKAGSKLEGGNWGAVAYQSLEVTKNYYTKNELNREASLYADLAHAFGQEFMFKLSASTPVKKNTQGEDNQYNMDQFYYQASVLSGFDMTYYMRDVNHFSLTQAKIDEIKSMELPMFAPIASPYQMTVAIDGVNYSDLGIHAYYVAKGATEQINLANFVDLPNVEIVDIKVVFDSVVGEFTKVSEYVYDYTPNLKSDAFDELTLVVKRNFTDGTVIPDAKIKVKFKGDNSSVNGVMYENVGFATIDDAINSNFQGLKILNNITSSNTNISTNVGNAIGVLEGQIVLPKGAQTLAIKGDDQVKLVVDYRGNQYIASIPKDKGYDFADKNSLINIDSDGSPMLFKLYMLNAGGKGSAGIGYISGYNAQGAPTIADLPTKFLRNKHYKDGYTLKDQVVQPIGNKGDYSVFATQEDMGENATVSVSPPWYGNSLPEYAVDGKKNTFYHSKTDINFPQDMVIDYGKEVRFNNITILPRSDGNSYGRIKAYELWAGDSPTNMTELLIGLGENSSRGINAFVNITTARYVKIVVLSVFSGNYFAISEITPSMALKSDAVLLANSQYITYNGEWVRDPYGSSVNAETYISTSGSATLKFKGSGFVIMGVKDYDLGVATIYIDNKKYGVMNCYADKTEYDKPLFMALGLSDKWHSIEIKANDDKPINFNYLLFDVADKQAFLDGKLIATAPLTVNVKLLIFVGVTSSVILAVIIALWIVISKKIKTKKQEKQKDKKLEDVVLINSVASAELDNTAGSSMKPIITKETQDDYVPQDAVVNIPMKPIKATPKAKVNATVAKPQESTNSAESKAVASKTTPKAKANATVAKSQESTNLAESKAVASKATPKAKANAIVAKSQESTNLAESKAVASKATPKAKANAIVAKSQESTNLAESKAVASKTTPKAKANATVSKPQESTNSAESKAVASKTTPKAKANAIVAKPQESTNLAESKAVASKTTPKAKANATVAKPQESTNLAESKAVASKTTPKAKANADIAGDREIHKPIMRATAKKETAKDNATSAKTTSPKKSSGKGEK